MKILQLCLRVPFPARDGGTMAMESLSDGLLANKVELDIFSLNTSKHFVGEKEIEKISSKYNLHAVPLNNEITPLGALTNFLGSEPFHVSRFYSQSVSERLKHLLQEKTYDAIVFESIFMAPYLELVKSQSQAVTVLRSHNIEYRIWERLGSEEKNPLKRYYLNLQMRRLKKFEMEMTTKFDLVAAITPVDESFYKVHGLSKRLISMPFGIDVSNHELHLPHKKGQLKIGFLGSMNWLPNEEGVRWFVNDIWPLVAQNFDGVECVIRGHHMPEDLIRQSNERLEIGGAVDDAQDFFMELDACIVPLKSGSGVRIKVLECMSLGVPVISTQVGYEGIKAVPNQSVLEADLPTEFVACIRVLLENEMKLKEIGASARALIANSYDKKKCAGLLLNEISSIKTEAA